MNRLTRRQFLRLTGVAAGAAVIGSGCVQQAPSPASPPATAEPKPSATSPTTKSPKATEAKPSTTPISLVDRYIAYCGLDCSSLCPKYGGTICPQGCLGETCATYCMEKCTVRACSLEHGGANCGLCEEYPCQKLEDQFSAMEKGGYASWAETARGVLAAVHQSKQ